MWFVRPKIEKLEAGRDISGLIKALRNRHRDVRIAATRALDRLMPSLAADGDARDRLVAAVGSGDRTVYAAIADLFATHVELFSTALVEALEDPAAAVRWRSAEILGRCKQEGAVEALCRALLEDEEDDVREAAREALEAIGGDAAREALEESQKALARKREAAFDVEPAAAESWAAPGAPVNRGPLEGIVEMLTSHDEQTFGEGLSRLQAIQQADPSGLEVLREAIRRRLNRRNVRFYEPRAGYTSFDAEEVTCARTEILALARRRALLADPEQAGRLLSAFSMVSGFDAVSDLAHEVRDVGGVDQSHAFQLLYNQNRLAAIAARR